jgi:hypothetical protein
MMVLSDRGGGTMVVEQGPFPLCDRCQNRAAQVWL